MSKSIPISDLESVIRRTVEQAVRDVISDQMPSIRAYATQHLKQNSPLAKARRKAGINQAELAEIAGLSQSSISRIEAGQLTVSSEQAKSIAIAITATGNFKGVTANDLARAIWLVHGGEGSDDAFAFLHDEPDSAE